MSILELLCDSDPLRMEEIRDKLEYSDHRTVAYLRDLEARGLVDVTGGFAGYGGALRAPVVYRYGLTADGYRLLEDQEFPF